MATRILDFRTSSNSENQLNKNTTLVLSFVPLKTDSLYSSQFPVVWKRISFGKEQTNSVKITYTARLGVSTTTTGNDFVYAGPFVEMKLGQSATLSVDKTSESLPFVWSTPKDGPNPGTGAFNVTNKVDHPRDISVGMITEEYKNGMKMTKFEPVLTWHGVESGAAVSIEFTPKLNVYSYGSYQATQILKGEVENVLGTFDLAKLSPPSTGETNEFLLYNNSAAGNALTLKPLSDIVESARVKPESS